MAISDRFQPFLFKFYFFKCTMQSIFNTLLYFLKERVLEKTKIEMARSASQMLSSPPNMNGRYEEKFAFAWKDLLSIRRHSNNT